MDTEATKDYLKSILKDLEEDNPFSAAFYLKELVEKNLINRLFEKALQKFSEEKDLWWQARSLQELGWKSELDDLMLKNSKEIEESGHPLLQVLLAKAKGDAQKLLS